jgi:nucleotide-binding universal stress UspA family protein
MKMYKRMLVPLDGSELAESVFTYAKELAGKLNIDVILLNVCTPEENEFVPMHQAYIDHAAEVILSQLQKVGKPKATEPAGKGIKMTGELAVGYPAEEIIRYSEENKIDLILMATHGRSGLKRWTLGSVADKVLRASKIPVLLIHPRVPDEIVYDKWPKQTILVPLDGSELAETVLPHVETMAKQRGPQLVDVTLLRICEPPAIPSYYAPELPDAPLNWGEYMQQETARCKQIATEYLTKVEERLKEKKISVHSEILVGRTADQIVDFVNKNPYSIIVMATHGRSGLSRWVYGSITDNILQGVCCPMLLIRTS